VRDKRSLACFGQLRDDSLVGVESAVDDYGWSRYGRQELIGVFKILSLVARQTERDGTAQRIDERLDFVLNPARDRPMAWSSPAFYGAGAGAVLMGAHNCAVDLRIFFVGVGGQVVENILPWA